MNRSGLTSLLFLNACVILPLIAGAARAQELPLDGASPREIVLEGGRGSTSLQFGSSGRLFIWAESEDVDPGLRVVRAGEPGQQAGASHEDLDGGGGQVAFLEFDLAPGEALEVTVLGEAIRSQSDGPARATLHANLAVETDETRQQAEDFRLALSFVQELDPEEGAAELPFLFELLPARGAELSPRQLAEVADLRRLPERLRTPRFMLASERLLEGYWDRHLPPAHPRNLEAKVYLAIALKRSGMETEALTLEREVLARRTRHLGPEHPETLTARLNVASTLFTLGDLDFAAGEFKALFARLPSEISLNDPYSVAVRQGHAVALLQRGFAHEAVRIFSDLLEPLGSGTGGLAFTDVRRNLGQALIEIGEVERAEGLLSRLLAEQRAALSAEDPELLRTQLHLALALRLLGDLDVARVLEERTLESKRSSLPEEHLDVQLALLQLAETMQLAQDFAGSRRLMEQVVEARTRALPHDHPELRTARVALAESVLRMGELEAARSMLDDILSFGSELEGDDVDVLRARELLAVALMGLGRPDEAQPLQESVVSDHLRLLPRGHPVLQAARVELAWILLARSQGAQALQLIGEMVRDIRTSVEDKGLRQAPRELQALTMRSEADVAAALSVVRLAEVDPEPELEIRVFELIETARSAAATQRRRLGLLEHAGSAPDLHGVFEELSEARAAVARAAQGGDLFAALRRRDRAERALHAQLSSTKDAVAQPEVSADAIRASLAPSEAGLGFWRHERWSLDPESGRATSEGDHYLVFVLRPDAALRRVELGPADAIDAAVEAWRSALLRAVPRGVLTVDEHGDEELVAGRHLRRLVLDPVRTALDGVDLCYLALDDALHVVPLDVLPEDELSDGVVGDKTRFVVCTSLKGLTRVPKPAAPPALLALGGIDYEDAAPAEAGDGLRSATLMRAAPWQPSFNYLPATDSEVQTLAHYFGRAYPDRPVQVLTAADATRAAFEAKVKSASYLHLATHAYFAPESVPSMLDSRGGSEGSLLDQREQARGLAPLLLCGLIFAGANQPGSAGSAGRMTADELSGLDLSRCELAVLSACETGLGVRRAGQGVASLRSALHAAGARSMITSLWKVPDRASSELMGHFYRALWIEGLPKADALWAAKSRLRSEVDPSGRARYATSDWAGWVFSGEPD